MVSPGRGLGLSLRRPSGGQIVCTLPDGQQITVTVGKMTRTVVQLFFAAPKDVRILRKELLGREPRPQGEDPRPKAPGPRSKLAGPLAEVSP